MKDSGACAIRSSGRDRAVERSVHTQGQRLFLTPTPYQEVVNVRLGVSTTVPQVYVALGNWLK